MKLSDVNHGAMEFTGGSKQRTPRMGRNAEIARGAEQFHAEAT